jgi:hypothetical protein
MSHKKHAIAIQQELYAIQGKGRMTTSTAHAE